MERFAVCHQARPDVHWEEYVAQQEGGHLHGALHQKVIFDSGIWVISNHTFNRIWPHAEFKIHLDQSKSRLNHLHADTAEGEICDTYQLLTGGKCGTLKHLMQLLAAWWLLAFQNSCSVESLKNVKRWSQKLGDEAEAAELQSYSTCFPSAWANRRQLHWLINPKKNPQGKPATGAGSAR